MRRSLRPKDIAYDIRREGLDRAAGRESDQIRRNIRAAFVELRRYALAEGVTLYNGHRWRYTRDGRHYVRISFSCARLMRDQGDVKAAADAAVMSRFRLGRREQAAL